ncbi:hypothetical protein ACHAXR_000597, partial [Thalassiosira sp. AJA248-18]
MTKSQKKKADKAKKAAAAAAPTTANEGERDGNINYMQTTANAAKKAAKKAEAKAKKAAMKSGGGGAADAPKAKSAPAAAVPINRPILTKSKLKPNQIAFNPNVSLPNRPVVALTTAILTNSIIDYELVSDHMRSGCALGLPSGNGEVSGDLAMARLIAKQQSSSSFLGGASDEECAMMDQWVDYATSLSKFGLARRALAIQRTLDGILVSGTYVIGHSLTLADVALFASL